VRAPDAVAAERQIDSVEFALQGERRDRSILFWKSLPVSDLTAVLSKAAIPLAVVPLVVFSLIVATHVSMLLLNMCVRLASGTGAAALRAPSALFELWIALLYGGTAIALWLAPVYGWLLLVSGWARRAAFLWAVLPLFAIGVIEKVAFNTTHFANLVKYRLFGWVAQALDPQAHSDALMDPLRALAPGRFLSTPGLWIGLAVAVVFLGAAARLRRYRGPI
jgi:ABC-2 type transport system permease protein